jgi:hypothetical protein
MATNKKGGGSGSRVVREVGVRNGASATGVRPAAVSQFGSSVGNHSTGQGKSTGYRGERYAVPPQVGGRQKLGNEVALNVGPGGPGKGRDFVSKSGSNCVTGPVNPGASRPGANKPVFPGFR